MNVTRSTAQQQQQPQQQGSQNQSIPYTEEYGDMHKIVLQGLMSSGMLDSKGVKKLFTNACVYLRVSEEEKQIKTSMEYISVVVKRINEQIRPFDLAIKSASCELTGKKYFLLLPTAEKSAMKLQTVFTKTEIEMFQICFDRMLRKYWNFSIPLNDAINVLHEIDPRAPKQHGYDFIHRLIDMSYFIKWPLSKDPNDYDVTIGCRGIREFEPLLLDMYKDVVRSCLLCQNIMIHGYHCPGCKRLVHKGCFDKYIKTSSICPCGTSWQDVKVMVRRTRITEEAIERYGQGVDLTPWRHAKGHQSFAADDVGEGMPQLEPQVSGRRRR